MTNTLAQQGHLIETRVHRPSIVPRLANTSWVELRNGLSTVLMGKDVARDL